MEIQGRDQWDYWDPKKRPFDVILKLEWSNELRLENSMKTLVNNNERNQKHTIIEVKKCYIGYIESNLLI